MTEKPRNATVYPLAGGVTLGVLSKRDYTRHLGESFRAKIDNALAVVQRYEVFRGVKS